jgi:anti-sigma factor ChrR (cupin superfamily)
MFDHLTSVQIEKFYAGALDSEEMVIAAEHLAVCSSCRAIFHEIFQRIRECASFSYSLSTEAWFKDDHIEFDDKVAIAEGKLDDEYLKVVNVHLSICAQCREAVRNFKEYSQQVESEIKCMHLPEENQ